MMIIRLGAIALGMLVLAGCKQAVESKEMPAQDVALAWRDVPAGGKFATQSMKMERYGRDDAVRCWPDSAGYRCLAASEATVDSISSMSLKVGKAASLPKSIDELRSDGGGYACSRNGLHRTEEEIDGPNGKLVSNMPDITQPRWTAGFVASYMKANKLSGQHYYDCVGILRSISDGSLATLGTTSIRPGQIGL